MSDPADLERIIEAQADTLKAMRRAMQNLAELTNDVMILRAALVSALSVSPEARDAVLARLSGGPETLFQPGEALDRRYGAMLQGRMAELADSIRHGADGAPTAAPSPVAPIPDVPDA
ncbi:hypothetical protein [Roseomonas sp. BN140053]|uniref:hypothetical protein n=1 Tax=Roseomonas sp. BN140053 TaxID=3391898 RepID=UPI0039EA152A